MSELPKCKITVIKKTLNKDLIEEFLVDENKNLGPCEKFEEGQEFIIDLPSYTVPDNFCDWAWADLRKEIRMIASGSNFEWMKQPKTTIAACSDWFRPVYFKIEKI